jgi:hypothetical protein
MCIPPFIFPSVTCFRMQFLRKISSIQLSIHSIVCRIFLSYLTLCDTSSFSHDRSKYSASYLSSTTFQNFSGIPDLFPKCPSFSTIQCYAPNLTLTHVFLKFKSNLLLKITFLLWNAALGMAILHLISRVHLASLVIMLSKHLKYSKFSICF